MNIQLSEHFTYKKLIRFTIPTILMMIFTSIYGIVDGIFVSNCVGSYSFSAINLIMPVIMILGSIGFMIGTGGSALVSKTIGEGEKEKTNRYFSMLIYLVIIAGFILTIIGIIFIKPIASLLGTEGNILNDCVIYGRVLLITLIAFLLQNCFQSFLVVAEKPQMGLIISICAGLTNMILDFLFIYVLKMGVFGAAIATGIIMYVGFIFTGTYLGYGIGSAPIISYHYGAGNKDELKNLFKSSIKLIAVTSTVMTLLAEILSKLLASIFVSYNIELLDMTTNAIRLFAISYIISGFNIFASSFFTALNNGGVSAAISFLRTLLFQIAMIFILPAIFGLNGIWLAVVVAEILALIVSILFLICNRKKYEYA